MGLLRTRAFRQKSWDSLNIHGSKTWFYSVFWAMRGTALKTWGESTIIIAIQAPLFSFISLTWFGFPPHWAFKVTVTRLAVSYFLGLGIQRAIHVPHVQPKFGEQCPPRKDLGLFFQVSPTAPVLLHLHYIDTRRKSSPLCLEKYKAITRNAGIFLQQAGFDQLPLLCHLKEDKSPMR